MRIILVAGLLGLLGGFVFYHYHTQGIGIMGRLIIIDGASSSGKTSVIKELMPLLGSSYQHVAVDDFVSEVFVKNQKKPLSEKEFFTRIMQQCDLMYARIRTLITQGNNVILDTVLTGLEGEKSVRDTFTKLEGLPRTIVLIYCPLPLLVERIKKRNEQAMQEHRPEEIRSMVLAVRQFGSIYRPVQHEGEPVLDTITHTEVERACTESEKEFEGNKKRFEQFKHELFVQLGVNEKDNVLLTPRLNYNLIIDTSKVLPHEAARLIKQRL